MSDKKSINKKSIKKRNWTFLLYPESAPSDWLDLLKKSGLMCSISPLHDKDFNADGSLKKPHYHVIVVFGSPTTFNNVNSFCSSLNQPIPQSLEQVRGMYRYFTHLDNPDKFQYSNSDIININGFSISDFVELTKSEISKIKKDILGFIIDNDLIEYSDLMDILFDMDNDWLDVASNNTIFFNTYIKSRRYRSKKND